jgi:predicted enzyme related to lactoylglutathione lyase
VRYMLLIYGDEQLLNETEREQCYRESTQLAHQIHAAGQYLAAAPLHPTPTATSVRVREGKRLVTDGPFAETREQLGGYFLIEARDLDEAIAIAARIPMASRGTVEIRPVIEIAGLPSGPDSQREKTAMTQNVDEKLRESETSVDARLAKHGALSYLELPAIDPRQSALFYERAVGWKIEWRAGDDPRFADPTGHLIGRWVTGRASAREPGLLPYIYVDHIDDAVERVTLHGGEVVKAPYPEGNLWVATIRDPAGNMIGLWQEGPR